MVESPDGIDTWVAAHLGLGQLAGHLEGLTAVGNQALPVMIPTGDP